MLGSVMEENFLSILLERRFFRGGCHRRVVRCGMEQNVTAGVRDRCTVKQNVPRATRDATLRAEGTLAARAARCSNYLSALSEPRLDQSPLSLAIHDIAR